MAPDESQEISDHAGQSPGVFSAKRRNWTKAQLYLREGCEPRQIVKDYGNCSWPIRLVGRILLYFEERALCKLRDVAGVPTPYGRLSKYALSMQFIEARPLSELEEDGGVPPEFAERLRGLFAEIEAHGVVHGDPHFGNILCDAAGRPYLVDFAFSYVRGMVPLLDGWIFRNLQDVRRRRLRKLRRVFYHEDVEDVRPAGWIHRGLLSYKRLYKKRKKTKKARRRKQGD